ncbi:TrgA family protein [Halovulum dunhuangense]|uniref:TrgA family protein n=1 Tax=Halovulum dunhuangense TaxID=1505036 RepID=A0A849L1C7_9RHOB|nr:TrgA family protein [Halovulum dunhuangense]NNU80051.1 TrgA family protein [Halovulum dunhuangense]
MPTAARLVAGMALAAAAAAMVLVLIYAYPDERFDRWTTDFLMVFGAVGFLVGWKSLGRKVETEGRTGIILGIRAAVTATIWIAFVLAIITVWRNILDADFQGADPMDAVLQLADKTVEYLSFVLHPRVAGIGLFLGVVVGVLTRNTHHRWN